SDSTSDRKLNYMARHVTTTDSDGNAELLCLGLTRPVNHTAAVTHQETVDLVHGLAETHSSYLDYVEADGSRDLSEHAIRFKDSDWWLNTRATNSDHASDQVLVSEMTYDLKMEYTYRKLGLKAFSELPEDQSQALKGIEVQGIARSLGGSLQWLQLPDEERLEHLLQARKATLLRLGKEAFSALPVEEQDDARFFVRAGCCMHKDLNAVVAANERMMKSWAAAGLEPPMTIFNRDNAATVALGPSEAADRAVNASIGGGTKTAQSLGCLLNHPDHKKGAGEPFRLFMNSKLGFRVTIPGTFQCRFQSTYEMAKFIIRYRDLIIDFLRQIRAMKGTHDFNNLENNIFLALHDGPTLSELAVLAAYGTAVGRPYMLEVRAKGLVDMMALGPLHQDVIDLCDILAQCPELLSAEVTDTGCVASLDGQPF
ncbi:hypothetical protein EXIGLDRAFT_582348, partial [Exidia glandulosa HHB12029]